MQKNQQRCADTKSGISQILRGMAENTVEMRKDSAKSGNVGITALGSGDVVQNFSGNST